MEKVEKRFSDRKDIEKESAEAVWKELKEAVVECPEKHIQRRQAQRQRLLADTNGACKKKHQTFAQWQEQRTNVTCCACNAFFDVC